MVTVYLLLKYGSDVVGGWSLQSRVTTELDRDRDHNYDCLFICSVLLSKRPGIADPIGVMLLPSFVS